MPIAIDGSGTITGISVGGIPDGVVDTDVLAANAVTTAKLGSDEASGLAKAWVNFNGTGVVAIRASYNVSSITDNGTGDYTVNLATAMADTNYTTVTGGGIDSYGTIGSNARQGPAASNISSSSCRITCGFDNGALTDWQYVAIAIFR
jgi:hypothetical protein